MIPLFIMAFKKGPFKSFLGIGIVYGLITCLTDGSPFYSLPLDYILGYGIISIVGFVSPLCEKITCRRTYVWTLILSIIAILLRLLFSTISGIIFYELNFIGSLVYNLTYILPSGGICIALFLILLKPLDKVIKNK